MASHILILLNFMNIAQRRYFFATSQASNALYRQHVIIIGRNKRPVERTVVVARRIVAHCCENIASLIKKFNLLWLRSAMTSDHLSELSVLHCHQERVDEKRPIEY